MLEHKTSGRIDEIKRILKFVLSQKLLPTLFDIFGDLQQRNSRQFFYPDLDE